MPPMSNIASHALSLSLSWRFYRKREKKATRCLYLVDLFTSSPIRISSRLNELGRYLNNTHNAIAVREYCRLWSRWRIELNSSPTAGEKTVNRNLDKSEGKGRKKNKKRKEREKAEDWPSSSSPPSSSSTATAARRSSSPRWAGRASDGFSLSLFYISFFFSFQGRYM